MYSTRLLLVTNILEKDYGEPVGILFLASYLRNEGFGVDIFDPQINGDKELIDLEKRCKQYPYDFVGISVLTSADNSINVVTRMAGVIKKILPNTIVGCGGVGASLRYKEFINIPYVDLVMIGEGERTITSVAEYIEKGNKNGFDNIPGVVTKNGKGFIKQDMIQDLDSIPFMARDTLDERIKNLSKEMIRQFEVRIFCGRGCFGTCTFCANYSVASLCNGYRVRQRSVESLVIEMEELHKKYGVNRFSFWDDNFLSVGEAGLQKAKKIKDQFSKLSFKPIFGIQTRVDTITDEIVSLLKSVGLQNVYLGVENINQEELKLLGKQVSPEQIKEALRILYKYGYSYDSESPYRLRIGYIAFTPYTTIRAIRENFEFIKEFEIPINKLNKKLLAFHDTPIRTLIDRDGLLTEDFYWHFNKPGVEQLYKAIETITKSYSRLYDKVRYISKVCKFNGVTLDWEKIKEIKKVLMEKTVEGVKEVCYLADDDYVPKDEMDEKVKTAVDTINNIGERYNILDWYNNFINENSGEVKNFEKAAYVFFD